MNFKIPTEIIWSAVASLGGIAKYLHLLSRGNKRFKLVDFLSRTFISGFSGYMFAHAAILMSPDFVMVAAGIGGYMGAEALDYVAIILKNKVKDDES